MPKISQAQIVNSALWAAYGDAVGFPTELISRDDFIKRNKISAMEGPIDWSRKVGGLFGPEIPFPVGTYSDDTQLRLSTSRAIRGDGYFDVESFAKIELPVWLNYALGAGRGSKAAAANLSLREVTWSQNFYNSNGVVYWNGGGNGAAMRIQPHVWHGHATAPSDIIREVVRNSVCTHGHPRAIIGAAIHALFLFETLSRNSLIPPEEWSAIGESAAIHAYEALVDDAELSLVWIPNWENFSKKTLQSVWADTVLEWHSSVEVAKHHCVDGAHPIHSYQNMLAELNGFKSEERGSGLKTVLFASALVWLFRSESPDVCLLASANTFKSDTDTIGTMAGALVGAVSSTMPNCEIQDSAYIQEEARRVYDIGAGKRQPSFRYPDLLSWTPPKNQSDAWVINQGKPHLKGLGELFMLGEPFASTKGNELLWQWCALPFGQTILAKRRKTTVRLSEEIPLQMEFSEIHKELKQPILPDTSREKKEKPEQQERSIDEYTNICIRSGFDATVLGDSLLALMRGDLAIEKAIAFTAIIAKAKIARERK
jgi:ADP-ribosylglycohydrolase